MKLVETYTGSGQLVWNGQVYAPVDYSIRRFQGMAASGLPIPGLHRIEGDVSLAAAGDVPSLVGEDVELRLEDGRTLRLTIADENGRVLAEGHGPRAGCSCC
jgi:hypothetical protein